MKYCKYLLYKALKKYINIMNKKIDKGDSIMLKKKNYGNMIRIVGIIMIGLFVLVGNSKINAQSRTPFTDLDAIIDYLDEARGTLANPIILPVRINLGNMTQADSGWQRLLIEIHNSGKPIALDLSACTMNDTEFNPINTISTGKANIVSIILPTSALSIRNGTKAGTYDNSSSAFNFFTELREVVGINITKIGIWAFGGYQPKTMLMGSSVTPNIKLLSVNFPRVTNIGDNAFIGCTGLTSVSFPLATNIGSDAFSSCTNLTMADIPRVTSIGWGAFYGCSSLVSANFPLATSIGAYAFADCTSLINVNFPLVTNMISIINGWTHCAVFMGCTSIVEVNFPEITTIGPESFSGCTNLKNVNFSKATTIIGSAFSNCTNLEIISFPLVTTITAHRKFSDFGGSGTISTFANCTNLINVNLPRVTSIGYYMFDGCTKLATLNIPRITSIGNNSFQNTGSTHLTITLGGGAPSLGTNIFNDVGTLKTVIVKRPEGVIGWEGDLPFNNLDTNNNWGNAFKGRGWTQSSNSYGRGNVNSNINLVIEEI